MGVGAIRFKTATVDVVNLSQHNHNKNISNSSGSAEQGLRMGKIISWDFGLNGLLRSGTILG